MSVKNVGELTTSDAVPLISNQQSTRHHVVRASQFLVYHVQTHGWDSDVLDLFMHVSYFCSFFCLSFLLWWGLDLKVFQVRQLHYFPLHRLRLLLHLVFPCPFLLPLPRLLFLGVFRVLFLFLSVFLSAFLNAFQSVFLNVCPSVFLCVFFLFREAGSQYHLFPNGLQNCTERCFHLFKKKRVNTINPKRIPVQKSTQQKKKTPRKKHSDKQLICTSKK